MSDVKHHSTKANSAHTTTDMVKKAGAPFAVAEYHSDGELMRKNINESDQCHAPENTIIRQTDRSFLKTTIDSIMMTRKEKDYLEERSEHYGPRMTIADVELLDPQIEHYSEEKLKLSLCKTKGKGTSHKFSNSKQRQTVILNADK